MTQQNSLVISIVIAALIIGGSVLYSGKANTTNGLAVISPPTPYPTPIVVQQTAPAAPFAPAGGAGFGCGIPAR